MGTPVLYYIPSATPSAPQVSRLRRLVLFSSPVVYKIRRQYIYFGCVKKIGIKRMRCACSAAVDRRRQLLFHNCACSKVPSMICLSRQCVSGRRHCPEVEEQTTKACVSSKATHRSYHNTRQNGNRTVTPGPIPLFSLPCSVRVRVRVGPVGLGLGLVGLVLRLGLELWLGLWFWLEGKCPGGEMSRGKMCDTWQQYPLSK